MNSKIIMDTNVAAKAAALQKDCRLEEMKMQRKCAEFIGEFVNNPSSQLILDMNYEIVHEYRKRIPHETDLGRIFWRWFNTYVGKIPFENMVRLEKDSDGNYVSFPLEERTEKFDRSDRKFIALSIAHSEHPPVVEASDGKWYGFRDVFAEYGVHIEFLDIDYAAMMYERKIENKRNDEL